MVLCFVQVKTAYINFLNHCYVDTEVEMKEIYTSRHMWTLFEDFLVDMAMVRNTPHARTRVHMRTCTHTCVHTHTRTCTHAHRHTHNHTHAHAHTHTYIYIYTHPVYLQHFVLRSPSVVSRMLKSKKLVSVQHTPKFTPANIIMQNLFEDSLHDFARVRRVAHQPP